MTTGLNNNEKQKNDRMNDVSDLDRLAKIFTSTEALAAFEKRYRECIMDQEPDNFFDRSVRSLSEEIRTVPIGEFDEAVLATLIERIVNELAAETYGFRIAGGAFSEISFPAADGAPVTRDELSSVPEPVRPMLTGGLYKRDLQENEDYKELLYFLKKSLEEKDPKVAAQYYGHFRQGLDILDLDPFIYEMLGMNRNNIGYWLPAIAGSAVKEGFFRIPDTTVVKVPLPILQLTRLDYRSLNLTTLKIVDDWAMKVFSLDESRDYFVKTGVFSSKFDFRNAKVTGAEEVRELGEYLLLIQHQASMYAGPLNVGSDGRPLSIYGAGTTNQFAVREYIHDTEDNPCIYNGLPLHTEYRVFVEFGDNARILGISPYWRPDVMKKRFMGTDDKRSSSSKEPLLRKAVAALWKAISAPFLHPKQENRRPKDMHDYVTFSAHENVLMDRYEKNKDLVLEHIGALIRDVDLQGQWSVDIMQNGDDFYIIDMATADTSALSDCVPEGLIEKSQENWIPEGLLQD